MVYYLTATLYVVSCLLLLLVVLLQQGKGGDMASAFGGGGSQTAFGARAGATVLTRATTRARRAVHARGHRGRDSRSPWRSIDHGRDFRPGAGDDARAGHDADGAGSRAASASRSAPIVGVGVVVFEFGDVRSVRL